MRISDWSSDVCSADLFSSHRSPSPASPRGCRRDCRLASSSNSPCAALRECRRRCKPSYIPVGRHTVKHRRRHHERSEEHTSELQSLMRISYAVFCLKKKKRTTHKTTTSQDIEVNARKNSTQP